VKGDVLACAQRATEDNGGASWCFSFLFAVDHWLLSAEPLSNPQRAWLGDAALALVDDGRSLAYP
jgi:hypothetical protein